MSRFIELFSLILSLTALFSCASTAPAWYLDHRVPVENGSQDHALWKQVDTLYQQWAQKEGRPGNIPMPDPLLNRAAKQLAELALVTDGESPNRYAARILADQGEYALPFHAVWFKSSDEAELAKKIMPRLLTMEQDGYRFWGAATSQKDGETAVALLTIRRDVAFDHPLPLWIEPDRSIRLEGTVTDDIGRLQLVVLAPGGKIRKRFVPYTGGRFTIDLTLSSSGWYYLQFDIGEESHGRRNAAIVPVYVGASKPDDIKIATAMTVEPTRFVQVMHQNISLWNRWFTDSTPRRMPQAERFLIEQANKEAEQLSPGQSGFYRSVSYGSNTNNGQIDCSILSQWTDDLGFLVQANSVSPTYRFWSTGRAAAAYEATSAPSRGGWRVLEIICGEKRPSLLDIGLRLPLDRLEALLRMEDEELRASVGVTWNEPYTRKQEDWIVLATLEVFQKSGNLVEYLQNYAALGREEQAELAKRLESPISRQVEHLLGVALRKHGQKDREEGAIRVLLLKTLLIAGRLPEAREELERWDKDGLSQSGNGSARMALAKAWVALASGDPQEAMLHLQNARMKYRQLHMDLTEEQIRRQISELVKNEGFPPPPATVWN